MNIVMIGAGAVGGYFGTRLHKAGANITFLIREKRAKQLIQHGLKIESVNGNANWEQPSFETNPTNITEADLVILATKGYHLEGTIDNLKKIVKPNTYILPLLNGVKHYHLLADLFGQEKIIGGLANIVATLNDKGHIIHTSKVDRITFGALHDRQQSICQDFSYWTEKANMQASWTNSIQQAIWNKYMFITAFSGLTTAADVTTSAILQESTTKNLFIQILHEMKRIAQAEGISLTEKNVKSSVKTIEQLPGDATSSMHQDFRKGLSIELEHLQGYALELAQAHQLDTPTLETIYGIIRAKSYQN